MTLFRVGGTPVQLHPTFLWAVAAWFGWTVVTQGAVGLGQAVVWVGVFFVSVLIHEVGHAAVASRLGVHAHAILLLPIGGATTFDARQVTPGRDVFISLAGPVANLGLGVCALSVWWLGGWRPMFMFGVINLLLGVGNLIPAFPMDGGRVLRALLVRRWGSARGNDVALGVGAVFAAGFAIVGVVLSQPGFVALAAFMGWLQWREHRTRTRLATAHRTTSP